MSHIVHQVLKMMLYEPEELHQQHINLNRESVYNKRVWYFS